MLFEQIKRNRQKTIFLFFILFLFFSLIGATFGAVITTGDTHYWQLWLFIALGVDIVAIPVVGIQLMLANRMIINRVDGVEITEDTVPLVYHIVQDVAMAAQMPMPRVFVIDTPEVNAFASGITQKHSIVAVTVGALETFTREELEGVLAHEMSHVVNHDSRNMTIIMALGAVVATLAEYSFWYGGDLGDDDDSSTGIIIGIIAAIFLLLAQFLLFLLRMAISRQQEYNADIGSANITRNPQGLISALKKLEGLEPMHVTDKATSPMYFGPVDTRAWTSTHPSTEKRIAALEKV